MARLSLLDIHDDAKGQIKPLQNSMKSINYRSTYTGTTSSFSP